MGVKPATAHTALELYANCYVSGEIITLILWCVM